MGTETSRPRTLTTYAPGLDAAERYPDWVIRHRPIGIPEIMDLGRKVILLDSAQTRAGKRSSLAHAVAHLDCTHQPVGGVLSRRQEVEAERLAASRLITLTALADAIRWHGERWDQVAELLVVDTRMLRVRLECLPAFRADEMALRLGDYLLGQTA